MPVCMNLSKKVRKNVLFILNYPGLATLRSSSKSKSNLMFKIVFQLLNFALFCKHAMFYPHFTWMQCPSHNKAWSVYLYVCHCDCRYVHHTILKTARENHSTHSQINSKQEKPTKVLPKRNCKAKTSLNQSECDSANGLHLLQNPDCAAHYYDRQFSILAKARTIIIKTQKLILCRQKEFVYSLQILR